MKRLVRLVTYGFVTWFVALAISFVLYPMKKAGDPFFGTVMTLVVTALGVLSSVLWFRNVRRFHVVEGFQLGLALVVMNVVLGLPFFTYGPMAMPLPDYLKDMGLTYLAYPIMTLGAAALASRGAALTRQALSAAAAEPELPGETGTPAPALGDGEADGVEA